MTDLEKAKRFREEAALAALTGILANPETALKIKNPEGFAVAAFNVGDALLVELSRRERGPWPL